MSLAGLLSGRPGRRRTPAGCSSIPSIRCRIRRSAAAPSPPARCSSARRGATPSPSSASPARRVGGQSVRVTEEVVWQTPFCRLVHFKRDIDPGQRGAASAPAAGGAHVGPLRHAAARHGRDVPARPRGLHHRLAGCAQRAARGRQLRPRRLHRHHGRHVPLLRRRRARVRGVPAVRAGAGRHRADGGGRRSRRAADADPRRRPDRHAHQPDRGQHAGREARHRLVPPQRHHQRALAVSGPRPAGLSGLPAALRLHDHEPRPAHAGAEGHVHASGARRRRLRRQAPRVLRRVSGGDGPHRRVLPADGRHRVRAAPDAARAHDLARPARSILPPSAGRR